MKEILATSPGIRVLASPWSAPPWMKTNKDVRGGALDPAAYDVYARYLVKYVQAMKAATSLDIWSTLARVPSS